MLEITTINDVARLAGVSASTVSRALSGRIPVDAETKQRVLEAVQQLNYCPNALAKGLKEGKTYTVGLIIPNIRNPIFPAVARGVEDVARKHGYTVILCNTDESIPVEMDYVNKLQKRWVDGLIFATATSKSSHILQLVKEEFPVVLLVRKMEMLLDAVVVNNHMAAYNATSLLLRRGCRKIALINGNPEVNVYRERLEGFIEAHRELGLAINEKLITQGVSGAREGYNACKAILQEGLAFDALFATSDRKAMGSMKALKEKGIRIPEDVKVIGFDDLDTTEMIDPPLTTMSQPTYEMGAKAMERLVKIINSKKRLKPLVEELEAQLVIRSTT